MTNCSHPAPFNSPLETGIRSLAILVAAYPVAFDLERLVEMDYLVVHSGDANGPESLHAALPMRAGELLVRRTLIERGLLLMSSRSLIQQLPADDGFNYVAGDAAAPFLASLTSIYSQRLKERAQWVVERFTGMTTSEIRQITHRLFDS
ncbi:MAG: threonine transporter [Candidatus Thiodiazotropha sp.]|nr:threonine transporter [Candidatus Thiodiazotropha sp.]MCM8884544.1 threonine transporter [Candidatus Thiodiazotropha sp.]